MTWLTLNWPQVLSLTRAHLLLSVPAILLSVIIAVPLGRIAFRYPRVGRPVLGAAALVLSARSRERLARFRPWAC